MDRCFKKCQDKFDDDERDLIQKGITFCNAMWDYTWCWPTTLANEKMEVKCPDNFIILDPRKSTYLECSVNGTWILRPGYIMDCFNEDFNDVGMDQDSQRVATVEEEKFLQDVAGIGKFMELFCVCLSLFSLIVALFVLTHFSTLKCHRTRIHKHLFGALIIFGTLLTITVVDESINFWRKNACAVIGTDTIMSTPILCETVVVMREYSRFAVFAWMFIEGYYLNGLVSAAVFGSPKFILYYFVGWISPIPFILLWVILMSTSNSLPCWHTYHKSKYYIYIIEVPRMLLLTINIILLINIIRVLVTKLRQNNSGDSQLVRKAIKATAVLTPLLGVCNLMYLVPPVIDATQPKARIVFTTCIVKLPPAIQGFIVALLYCFLNGEVLTVLRRRWSSWRLRRISGAGNTHRRTSASVFTTLTDDSEVGTRRASARQTYVRMATIRDDDGEQVDEKSPCAPQVYIADQDPNQNNKLNGHV